MSDTISQEDMLVSSLCDKNSVENLLERIADYHYIYGNNRSWFMSDWTQNLKNAIMMDVDYTSPDKRYVRTKPVAKEMLANATQYSAYETSYKKDVIDTICKKGQDIYETYKRKNFKLTLAGKREMIW